MSMKSSQDNGRLTWVNETQIQKDTDDGSRIGNLGRMQRHCQSMWRHRTAQVQLELNFSRKDKGNKKASYNYMFRENVGSLLNRVRGPGDIQLGKG